MSIYAKIILLSVAAFLAQHVGRILYDMRGCNDDIFNHYPGECKYIKGFSHNGSEDVTLLPSGRIMASSGVMGFYRNPTNPSDGALYLLDPSVSTDEVEILNLVGLSQDQHFIPHGLDHWVHANGSVSVFVVVHYPESVMRFLYDGKKTLTLTKIYQNSTFMSMLNSVLVTGEDNFYASNSLVSAKSGDTTASMLQFVLGMATGNIIRVEGDQYSVVHSGLHLANGLTGNSRYVYVACMDAIHMLSILPDKTLELHKTLEINTGSMDNLKLDSDGNLWIGCQPLLHAVIQHLDDHSVRCPSEVLRVKDPEGSATVESTFKDGGNVLNASSVGLYTDRKLYVGTVNGNFLVCDVNYLG